jgi:hypothetical protein
MDNGVLKTTWYSFHTVTLDKFLTGDNKCGERQVQDCQLALAHGTGEALGTRHGGVTMIMGRD